MTASLVSRETRARVRAFMEPVALGLGRLGLTPNALTLVGFGIACLAAAAAAAQAWALAGVLVVAGGVFDLFDGALARATGRTSRLGAFLDSTFDRLGEAVVYLGIVWGSLGLGLTRLAVLAAGAMAAAFMVSYTRAKAESLGFTSGTGMANVGVAPREVRIVVLTLGLIAAPLALGALEAALGVIAVLATVTTIQRIVHTSRQAATHDKGEQR